MKRPDPRALRIALAVVVPALTLSAASRADIPENIAENWYRTELLIFVREDAASRGSEQWEPLPELRYPEGARFLIDPSTADRRLGESRAYASAIDARGVQTLQVPAPIRELLDHDRPDAITVPAPDVDAELDTLLLGEEPEVFPAVPDTVAGTGSEGAAPDDPNAPLNTDEDDAPDPNAPLLALPYELLDNAELDFSAQARGLRRRGHRVLFHSSWWARLDEQNETPVVLIDRSGDSDTLDWPALQGSVHIYRSRYLHIAVDLWLNTLGDYLPEGWQIDAPPRAEKSLQSATLGGVPVDPWSPAAPPQQLETLRTDVGPIDASGMPADPNSIADTAAAQPAYPWHHAIVHRQSRRMRSTEIHYLDHPVIGVLVRISPLAEDELPLLPPSARAFRERHGLPIEAFQSEKASDGSESGG